MSKVFICANSKNQADFVAREREIDEWTYVVYPDQMRGQKGGTFIIVDRAYKITDSDYLKYQAQMQGMDIIEI